MPAALDELDERRLQVVAEQAVGLRWQILLTAVVVAFRRQGARVCARAARNPSVHPIVHCRIGHEPERHGLRS